MAKEYLLEWETTHGDDIEAWGFQFETDISASDFKFESKMENGFGKVTLCMGQGLTKINDTNILVFDAYKEERPKGLHIGYMKCYDEKGERTLNMKFKIIVEEKKL